MNGISSALLSGFVLAKPVMEIRTIYDNRGRTLASMALAGAAFGFVMTALVIATMEMVLQYDSQGFVQWSVMLTLASIFVLFAVALAWAAKATFPKPRPAVTLPIQEIVQLLFQTLADHLPSQSPSPEPSVREEAREMSEVAAERDKIRDRARGDLDLDQMPTPAFTH